MITSRLAILAASLQLACLTPRAAVDLVRPSSVAEVGVSPTPCSRRVEVSIVYGYIDKESGFSFEPFFHPISTSRRVRLSVPQRCSPDRLAVHALAGPFGPTRLEPLAQRETLYSHFGSRGRLFRLEPAAWFGNPSGGRRTPPKVTDDWCVLWLQLAGSSRPSPGNLTISSASGEHLLSRPVPSESPLLQPKRWAWLLVTPLLDLVIPFVLAAEALP